MSYPELTLCGLPKKTFYYYPYLGPSLILIGEVWRKKQAETDYSGLLSKIVSDVSRPFRQASWGRAISDTKFAFYEDESTSRIDRKLLTMKQEDFLIIPPKTSNTGLGTCDCGTNVHPISLETLRGLYQTYHGLTAIYYHHSWNAQFPFVGAEVENLKAVNTSRDTNRHSRILTRDWYVS